MLSRLRNAILVVGCSVLLAGNSAAAAVEGVDRQPLEAQVKRLLAALEFQGEPFSKEDVAALNQAMQAAEDAEAIRAIQAILDRYTLAMVHINPESRVKVRSGPATATLLESGWRSFLVKVHNEAGVTAPLDAYSPNADPQYTRATNLPEPPIKTTESDVRDRFIDCQILRAAPMTATLSGLELEYVVLQVYCRDRGKREAEFTFSVGQGTQDLGFRASLPVLFNCLPATEVTLDVLDERGREVMASFEIRDAQSRIYPSQARRFAPDFFFHPQIYRKTGETVLLAPGTYTVELGRGPEYHLRQTTMTVPDQPKHTESFRLERWIEPKATGWWSGDHHVHAAGCAHYDNPVEGVLPEHMFRHILGEDLNVGCVLSWGPCWYFQKQFFEGQVHPLSLPDYLMRYDVEVSGFPSSHAGHLCLLRLKQDDYPGTTRIEEWPSWDLPVLRWGKEQGGVVGFSHSGWGLKTETDELPQYTIPPFDGIGANEYIVDVVHDACDFISAVDTPAVWELNIWYHTLSCGYRCRISGETDFPCIYGERVGLGRVYVHLDGQLDFDAWVEGLKSGRSYVSDGLSHLLDFTVNQTEVGQGGSEVALQKPGTVTVRVKAAALLAEQPKEAIRRRRLDEQPYWHVERSRVGKTRKVPVEIVVNGYPVARKEILADGSLQELMFEIPVAHSSWIAARIFPSSHTNPVFVLVDGKPIRASRRSAEYCLASVAKCWEQKKGRIRPAEQGEAQAAFRFAEEAYRRILVESIAD